MSASRDREPLQGAPAPARSTRRPPDPSRESDETALTQLQRAVGNAGMSRLVNQATARSIEDALGGGTPVAELPEAQRAASSLESAESAESAGAAALADVRIHADQRAAELGTRLGAQAFTFGRDVFMGPDSPALGSPDGQAVLRHELTHVIQQGGQRPGRPRRVSAPGSPAEVEAGQAAAGGQAAAAGRMASTEHAAAGAIHRQAEELEEEVALLPVDTVHRQVAVEEEEIEATAVPAEGPAAQAGGPAAEAEAPAAGPEANPALVALYDVAVLRKVQTAADALKGEPPDARAAFDAIYEAMMALRPLGNAYSESDRELGFEIEAYGNGLNVLREMLAPFAGAGRTTQDAARYMEGALSQAAGLRSRLH